MPNVTLWNGTFELWHYVSVEVAGMVLENMNVKGGDVWVLEVEGA